MDQAEFNTMKAEIRTYLDNVVTPIVNTDFGRYANKIAPVLHDLRNALFACRREDVNKYFEMLRNAVEKNETVQK